MKKLLVIISLITSNLISGQDSLSLSEAIKIGLEKNYDIQLTQKNIAINQLLNNWARPVHFQKSI